MNRFHVHLHVRDVEVSVKFYTALFGREPTKQKSDYAKWMLDDPYVNFAITTEQGHVGLSHLGIQVDDERTLSDVSDRARSASGELLVERGAHCGYAVGNKTWANDPQGVRWETFHTYTNEMADFGCGAEETWREDASRERQSVSPPSCGVNATPARARESTAVNQKEITR
jgi:catechol 2,3-dioxygenase-like lactoylglutathione lyase family enzyme